MAQGIIRGERRAALVAASLMLAAVVALAGCGAAVQKDEGVRDMAVEGASASELNIAQMFPDAGVAASVSAQLDTDNSGGLSDGEIQAATTLNVQNAVEVAGLGRLLPQLVTLTVSGDTKVVDVSDMPALISLDVSGTAIEKLDVSRNSHLSTLRVIDCADLEVALLNGNEALRELDFSSCKSLRGVDVTGCTGLSSLKARDRVAFNGLEDTQLQERWLVTDFTWQRPAYEAIAALSCSAQAEYDKEGRLIKLVTSGFDNELDGTHTFTYNDDGRLDAVMEGEGDSAKAQSHLLYDEAGRVKAIEGKDAATFSYHDDGRLLQAATDKSPYEVAYSYNDNGQVTSVSAGDGRGQLSYDGDSLTEVADMNSAATMIASYDTVYNQDGMPDTVVTVFGTAGTGTQTFAYDDRVALTDLTQQRANGNRGTQLMCPTIMATSFLFDDNGNLTDWEPMYAESGVATGKGSITYTRVFLPKDSTQPRQDFLFAGNLLDPRVVPGFFSPAAALDAELLAYTNGMPDSAAWIPRAEPIEVSKIEPGEASAQDNEAKAASAEPQSAQAPTAADEEEDLTSPERNNPEYRPAASSSDFVLPESDSRKYTAAELEQLSDHDLFLARNEIFARHGRQFSNDELREYFEGKSWYDGTVPADEFDAAMQSVLNDAEKANVAAIQAEEARR